ncbi:MAG: 50S ribosomal protein L29 [Bacteroidota bacterium]
MKAKDIRELTDAEIHARIREDEEMLQKMYFNNAISEIESPAKIRGTKRNLARMRTILREREMAKTAEASNS